MNFLPAYEYVIAHNINNPDATLEVSTDKQLIVKRVIELIGPLGEENKIKLRAFMEEDMDKIIELNDRTTGRITFLVGEEKHKIGIYFSKRLMND